MSALAGCGGVMIGVILTFNLGLAIAAIDIGNDSLHAPCLGHFGGISFSYPEWLVMYGWISISVILAEFVLFLCFLVSAFVDLVAFTSLWGISLVIVFFLSQLFQLAWYVVGGILLFTEVTPTCAPSQLYNFGLTLFIITSVALVCTLFSRQKESEK